MWDVGASSFRAVCGGCSHTMCGGVRSRVVCMRETQIVRANYKEWRQTTMSLTMANHASV